MIRLLGDIFNANWSGWQDITFYVLAALIALLLLSIVIVLVTNRTQASGRQIAKRIGEYERQVEMKRKLLEIEKEKSSLELEHVRKELKEKAALMNGAETAALTARQQYSAKKQEIKKLLETVEMTKQELAEHQKREGTNIPEDIVVNALTDRMLASSSFEMDATFMDCKLPAEKTLNYTLNDVADYISKKSAITASDSDENKSVNYQIEDNTFAVLFGLPDNKIRLTFKCGPSYGAKLCKHLKYNVSKAKFPSGLLWFTVDNETVPCALERIKQMIDISYRIAGLGY